LIEIKTQLEDLEIPEDVNPRDLAGLVDLGHLSPSVIFGAETAILNLLANSRNQPLAALLNPKYRKIVTDVGLLLTGKYSTSFRLTGESFDELRKEGIPADTLTGLEHLKDQRYARDEFLDTLQTAIGKDQALQHEEQVLIHSADLQGEVEELEAAGFKAIKLKVGAQPVEKDIENVRLVRERVGDRLQLSLDANRAWDLESAIYFGQAVAEYQIEYFEEPINDVSQLGDFHRQTGIPLALDETLREIEDLSSLESLASLLEALIVKPDTHGHLEETLKMADFAQNHGLISVITNPFHAGLAGAAMANIAACVNEGDVPS